MFPQALFPQPTEQFTIKNHWVFLVLTAKSGSTWMAAFPCSTAIAYLALADVTSDGFHATSTLHNQVATCLALAKWCHLQAPSVYCTRVILPWGVRKYEFPPLAFRTSFSLQVRQREIPRLYSPSTALEVSRRESPAQGIPLRSSGRGDLPAG